MPDGTRDTKLCKQDHIPNMFTCKTAGTLFQCNGVLNGGLVYKEILVLVYVINCLVGSML